jgi:hypothetical protein
MLKTNKMLTLLDLSDNEIGAFQKYDRRGDKDGMQPTPEGPAALADGLKAQTPQYSSSMLNLIV